MSSTICVKINYKTFNYKPDIMIEIKIEIKDNQILWAIKNKTILILKSNALKLKGLF